MKRKNMRDEVGRRGGQSGEGPPMAWKASKGCGTDPAAHEGHFEKATSRANNSNNAEREAGGRERQVGTCFLEMITRSESFTLPFSMFDVECNVS